MTPVDAHANRMLRSEGVTDAVIDAIAACGASPRRESFLTLAKSFGFDGFSYIVLGALSAHPRIVEHWTSSGTAWSARYAERGYHLVDPRVTLTRNRTVPVAWDKSIGEREPRTCDFLYDAARHDLRGGIAWSAFDARVGRAVVTWDSKHAEVARGNLAKAGFAETVEVILGPAAASLTALSAQEPFDFIFIDADKAGYPRYLELCLPLARPGTLIIADNMVREGKIIDAGSADAAVQGVRRFNEMISQSKRLTATAIQTVGDKGYDGFVLARVTD